MGRDLGEWDFGDREGRKGSSGSTSTMTQTATALAGTTYMQIKDDGEGTIWVATYGEGLSQFNTKTGGFHHYKHIATDPNSPGSDRLHTLLSDSNGIVWIGTYDGGLDRLDTVYRDIQTLCP